MLYSPPPPPTSDNNISAKLQIKLQFCLLTSIPMVVGELVWHLTYLA
jgi:hypothetical protein